FYIDLFVVRIYFQPGSSGGKSTVLRIAPLHRGSGIVSGPVADAVQKLLWIFSPFDDSFFPAVVDLYIVIILNGIKVNISHTDFFPLIDIGSSLHGHQHGIKELLAFFTVFFIIASSGNSSWLVMVGPVKTVPCFSVH